MINKQIKDRIKTNLLILQEIKKIAFNESDLSKKLNLLKVAAHWAVFNHTGRFADCEIESALNLIASSLEYELPNLNIKNNHSLIVSTKLYSVGGHTRLIKYFIENNKLDNKTLILTGQGKDKVPDLILDTLVDSNCKLVVLPEVTDIEKAKVLRKFAFESDYILLFTNMWDVVPNLAFGTSDLKTPVYFYNHADHVFWLGVSIVDRILELSEQGADFSFNKRAVTVDSNIVGIPIDAPSNVGRHKNNFNKGKIIFTSMASPYKYCSFNELNFADVACKIVEKIPNSVFYIIGPNRKHDRYWQNVYEISNHRVEAVGYKTGLELDEFKLNTYIYIDSFPMPSYTAMFEFAYCGIPVLCLKTPFNELDILSKRGIYLNKPDQIISEAIKIVDNPNYAAKYKIDNELKVSGVDKWIMNINSSIDYRTRVHHVKYFEVTDKSIDYYDEYLFYASLALCDLSIPFSFLSKVGIVNKLKILFVMLKYKVLSRKLILQLLKRVCKKILVTLAKG